MRPLHLFIPVLSAFATPVASQIDVSAIRCLHRALRCTNFLGLTLPFCLLFAQEIIDVAHFAEDTPRYLQSSGVTPDLWEIPEPDINFNKYRLMIDYTVRDSIENSAVTINIFRDNRCTRDVTFNEYLPFRIIYDDTPQGDGTGTRNVRIGISIDPREIKDSRVISYVGSRAIVSFCLRFNLYDLRRKDIIQNSLDTILNVGVVLTDNVGIVELVGDQVPFYGIDTYRCNSTNGAVESLEPISQGQIFRFCMMPNNWTLYDGIYIRSVDSFTWSLAGGDLTQTAITNGQRIGDGGLTTIDCDEGSKICVLQSRFMNGFFTGPGVLQGIGSVVLQFGGYEGDRRSLRDGVAESRALYEIGEFVTVKQFNMTANIHPSEDEFLAEAYKCNSKQEPVGRRNRVFIGEEIRVCVRPDEVARAAGTYMRTIESFSFERGSTLVAVEPGGEAPSDGSSLVLCSRGATVCSFKTQFPPDFFLKNGTARGIGVAILQYGPESGARRLRAKNISRIAQAEDGDPGYAGSSQLSLDFDVAFSKLTRIDAATWWVSSPTHLKILCVMGIGIAVMLVCCCFGGCICLYQKDHQEGPSPLAADRDLDESIDAFMDSKASFYSDDEFFTDYSESSDESSSENDSDDYDDYDDEDDIACIPAPTPHPHGLSQSMHGRPRQPYQVYPGAGLSSSLRGRGRGRGRGQSQGRGQGPAGRGYYNGPPRVSRPQDSLSSSTHGRPPPAMYHPDGITSIPRRQDGLSSSIRGRGPAQRRPPSNTLSTSQHRVGRGPAQRRPSNTLSASQHGGRGPAQRRPSNTLSTSQQHGGGWGPAQRRPSDRLSTSQDAPAPPGVKQWKEKAIKAEIEEPKGKLSKTAKQKAKNVKAPKEAGKKGGKKTGKLQKSSVKRVESPVDEDPAEAQSSIPLTISTDGTGSEDPIPEVDDVCFDADDHPGTVAFLKAVKKSLKKFADEDYSPSIYRAIKKQLPDRKFFICDDEDEPNKWRETSKSELIDLFWKYCDKEK
jgi:hypothetical protein